jgi:hypothetical protein
LLAHATRATLGRMLRDCPLCAVALPPAAPAHICERCGLTWAEVNPDRWVQDPAPAASPAPAGRPLRIVLRPSLTDVALYLFMVVPFGLAAAGAGALMITAIVTQNVPAGVFGWLVLMIALPLSAAVVLFVVALGGGGLLRIIFPERLTSAGDTLRVRVVSRWGLRTDVRLPRTDLTAAALLPWQLGTREVWMIHRSGAAFRVIGAVLPEAARPLRAQLDTWVNAALNRCPRPPGTLCAPDDTPRSRW